MTRPSLSWMKAWEAPSFDIAVSNEAGSPPPLPRVGRIRIILLVGVHLVLGMAMAGVALAWPGDDKPFWMGLPMMGLACSEVLLLGMWLGFSQTARWLKLIGFVAGMIWLMLLAVAPSAGRGGFTDMDDLGATLLAVLFVVALASLVYRSFVAKIVRRDDWPQRPLAAEMQFTLKSIVALTIAVAALLALRNLIQLALQRVTDGEVMVLGLIAILAWLLLLRACLGPGRPAVRVPAMLVAMAGLGLIFPYYTGGPSFWYATWPALMVTIAGYAAASLLVLRTCGYRLCRFGRKSESSRAATFACKRCAARGISLVVACQSGWPVMNASG